MSELKRFYQTATQNDALKAELTAVSERKLRELKNGLIDDYIAIAQKYGVSLTVNDFENDSVSPGMLGTGGCLLIDSGCFICGEIDPGGGCIIIGVR